MASSAAESEEVSVNLNEHIGEDGDYEFAELPAEAQAFHVLTREFGNDRSRRAELARSLGLSYDGDRDIYDVLGYELFLDYGDYLAMYERGGIAGTIVDAPASATYRDPPEITDTPDDDSESEFDKAYITLIEDKRLAHYWERVDRLCGIGKYSVLVIGAALDTELEEEIPKGSLNGPGDLEYLATFGESRIRDIELEEDPLDGRYGLPKFYDIEYESGDAKKTHWSRVIHVAEDLLENEVEGRPRLQRSYNRLEDIEKVMGAAAESFWRHADRKYVMSADKDMGQIKDSDELKEEARDMIHGFRSMIFTKGTKLETLDGEAVDPTGVIEMGMKLISGDVGIPKRMLEGSERGELASTQDRATFFERIGERRIKFAGPAIVRATIDRFIKFGILPDPGEEGYDITWPDLFALDAIEKAEVMATKATALKEASPMGDPGNLAWPEEIREAVLEWGPELGSETSLDITDIEVPEEGEDTEEDRDELDEIIEDGDVEEPTDVRELLDRDDVKAVA